MFTKPLSKNNNNKTELPPTFPRPKPSFAFERKATTLNLLVFCPECSNTFWKSPSVWQHTLGCDTPANKRVFFSTRDNSTLGAGWIFIATRGESVPLLSPTTTMCSSLHWREFHVDFLHGSTSGMSLHNPDRMQKFHIEHCWLSGGFLQFSSSQFEPLVIPVNQHQRVFHKRSIQLFWLDVDMLSTL